MLLAFFDAVANLVSETVFCAHLFSGNELRLIVDYLSLSRPSNIKEVGELIIDVFYVNQDQYLRAALRNIWVSVFCEQNMKEEYVELFQVYGLPAAFVLSTLPEIIEAFPMFDETKVFLKPESANSYCRSDCAARWGNRDRQMSVKTDHGHMREVPWWLKSEAEEWDLGVRHGEVSGEFRCDCVEFSRLFNVQRFLERLKCEFVLRERVTCDKVVVVLTTEKTEIEVRDLVMVNFECLGGGEFGFSAGWRSLNCCYLKVCEMREAMVKIPIYVDGGFVGELCVVGEFRTVDCAFFEARRS
jgi:hypothetical protein